jgi:hypothetical protein
LRFLQTDEAIKYGIIVEQCDNKCRRGFVQRLSLVNESTFEMPRYPATQWYDAETTVPDWLGRLGLNMSQPKAFRLFSFM